MSMPVRFGFGQPVGWPLGAEIDGSLMPVDQWDGYTISRLPTGYAVGATAIQVHQAMATVANNGIRARPRILKEVFDPTTDKHISLGSERRDRVLSDDVAQVLKQMLTRVVSAEGNRPTRGASGIRGGRQDWNSPQDCGWPVSIRSARGFLQRFFPGPRPEGGHHRGRR
jgi:cell division protein FtsI (penicillin-binding protein 3)